MTGAADSGTGGPASGHSSNAGAVSLSVPKARSLAPELLLLKLKPQGRQKFVTFFMVQDEVLQSSEDPGTFHVHFIPDPNSHAPNRRKASLSEVTAGELKVMGGNGVEVCGSRAVSVNHSAEGPDPTTQGESAHETRRREALGFGSSTSRRLRPHGGEPYLNANSKAAADQSSLVASAQWNDGRGLRWELTSVFLHSTDDGGVVSAAQATMAVAAAAH